MIKYTKEIKLDKNNLKKVLVKLLKHKTILFKYKSQLILAGFVAVIFFALGYIIAYNKDLTWVYANRSRTEKFVRLSAQSYELQRKIIYSYADAIKLIMDCNDPNKSPCDAASSAKKLTELSDEKDKMVNELNNLTIQTGNLLKEMGFEL